MSAFRLHKLFFSVFVQYRIQIYFSLFWLIYTITAARIGKCSRPGSEPRPLDGAGEVLYTLV